MTLLSIPDMSCDHCKAAVTAALTAVPGVASVAVNLDRQTAEVTGDSPLAALLSALDKAGYPASPSL
jgi:copper chaperone